MIRGTERAQRSQEFDNRGKKTDLQGEKAQSGPGAEQAMSQGRKGQ